MMAHREQPADAMAASPEAKQGARRRMPKPAARGNQNARRHGLTAPAVVDAAVLILAEALASEVAANESAAWQQACLEMALAERRLGQTEAHLAANRAALVELLAQGAHRGTSASRAEAAVLEEFGLAQASEVIKAMVLEALRRRGDLRAHDPVFRLLDLRRRLLRYAGEAESAWHRAFETWILARAASLEGSAAIGTRAGEEE